MAFKDKTINHNEDSSKVVTVAMGAVHDVSVSQVQQYVSDVPTGVKAEAVRVKLQPTKRTKAQSLQRSTVQASHTLNPPLKDGLRFTRGVYLVTHDMAENYQRTHNDAFFEQWADLIIDVSNPDKELVHSTSELRMSTKKYSKRLAHYYWQYSNAVTMLYACFANLSIASRFQGTELNADIAYRTRWGVIQSNTILQDSFPVPKGLVKYIIDNSKYAIGKTSYGADIISMPLWVSDVYGNRGCHSIPVDNLVTTRGGSGTSIAAINVDNEANNDAIRASNLLTNIRSTIYDYSIKGKTFNVATRDGKKTITWAPTMPRIENGALHVEEQGDKTFVGPLNLDNIDGKWDQIKSGNPLTNMLWNNYFFWLDYLITNFPEMMDENSDMYEFAITQLGLFESSPEVKTVYDGIRNVPNVNMNDLLKRMVYKGNNEMNTATIVRLMPLMQGTGDAGASRQSSVMNINFERYDVDIDNIPKMIAQAKSYPGLTPAVFGNPIEGNEQDSIKNEGDTPNYPFVINTIPSVCFEGGTADVSSQLEMSPAIVGKFATLFDMACSNSLDEEAATVVTSGVSAEFAEKYVKSGDATVYEEDPTSLHFPIARLIDNTDPYQCGFNLMCAYENAKRDETLRFFADASNYADDVNAEITSGMVDSFTGSDGKKYARHIANPEYFSTYKYLMIFLGTNIFDHPIVSYAKLGAANPMHSMSLAAEDTGEHKVVRLNQHLTPNGTVGSIPWSHVADDVYFGSSTYSNGVTTPSTPFLTKSTKVATSFVDFMFSPYYGPIKIMTVTEDINSVLQLNPFQGSGTMKETNAAQKFNAGLVSPDHFDALGNGTKRDILYLPQFDAAKTWLPFIASFKLRPIVEDTAGRYVFGNSECVEINAISANQFFRTMFNKVRVQFTGIEDVQCFDRVTDIKFAQQMDAIKSIEGQTWDMPENNIIAAPRRSPKAQGNGKTALDSKKIRPNFQPDNHTNYFKGENKNASSAKGSGQSSPRQGGGNDGSVVDTTPSESKFAESVAAEPSINNGGSIGAKRASSSKVLDEKDSSVDDALKSVLG